MRRFSQEMSVLSVPLRIRRLTGAHTDRIQDPSDKVVSG